MNLPREPRTATVLAVAWLALVIAIAAFIMTALNTALIFGRMLAP